ncbi:MAG: hypothetical protein ACYS9X_25740 [Planctomycetota bacterium]|jgi:hypothetical protein
MGAEKDVATGVPGSAEPPTVKPKRWPAYLILILCGAPALTIAAWKLATHRMPPSSVLLAQLDGVAPACTGPLEHGPDGAWTWLRVVTVGVPAEGEPFVADVRDATRWRGIALPRGNGCVEFPEYLNVRIGPDGAVRIARKVFADTKALDALFSEAMPRGAFDWIRVSPAPAAPWKSVMCVVATAADHTNDIRFESRYWSHTRTRDLPSLRDRLRRETGLQGSSKDHLETEEVGFFGPESARGKPAVCLRVRADADAPFSAVRAVLTAAAKEHIWRISLVGLLEGREVEIGPDHGNTCDPAPTLSPPGCRECWLEATERASREAEGARPASRLGTGEPAVGPEEAHEAEEERP